MFQVLQRPGMPGLTISAFDPEKGESMLADVARRSFGGRACARRKW